MPEGDTLKRIARRLSPLLAGRSVTRFDTTVVALAMAARTRRLVGRTVTAVEARGKHLLLRVEEGLALHTHLGLQGNWRVAIRGAPLRPSLVRHLVLETEDATVECVRFRVAELLTAAEEARHPALSALGPDVLGEGFASAGAARRVESRAGTVAEALLDQGALAGVGNIYKNEALFLCRLDPFAPAGSVETERLQQLVETARHLMRRSLGPGPRRTTSLGLPGRYWVYGRAGRPCWKCGTPIAARRHGTLPRRTFWCPSCQARPADAVRP
jgi:endonuclease VIII